MRDGVRIERAGEVFTIVIDRETRRNALNEAVALGIIAGLDEAEADRSVRAVVLTGAGDKAFCAGGDLQPAADGTPFAIDAADPRHYVARLLRRMDACRLPLVARVNGHALAGGFGLVCACDLVVAREDALLGVTEVKVGLFPMMILPYLLRILPYRTMMEMCLTGEPLKASDAIGGSLVNYVVAAGELDAKTHWLVNRRHGQIADRHPPRQASTGENPRDEYRQRARICPVHAREHGAHGGRTGRLRRVQREAGAELDGEVKLR